jgi:hypothetical protein
LDPASRRNLWDVVKSNKAGRAIVLTTHSMEEAEMLCDRLGIFVDGRLVCIGNPKEITSRYGGFLVCVARSRLCCAVLCGSGCWAAAPRSCTGVLPRGASYLARQPDTACAAPASHTTMPGVHNHGAFGAGGRRA